MATDAQPDSKLPFLELARQRFKRCAESESAQRKAILAAKDFRAGNQWPDDIRIARLGGLAEQGKAAQPARPCLTIDRVSAPVRQVSNTVRSANFAIDVHPNGFGADDETARILKGLLRQIQNDARGEDPIEWSADGAAEGGLGWFRVLAEYCYNDPDTPPEALFDQDLKLGRIPNSLAVYCDPAAKSPTKRDARFMFVVDDMSRHAFTQEYGEAAIPSMDEWRSEGDADQWVGDDLIRVAEYWTVEFDKVKVWMSPDGAVTMGTTQPKDYDADSWRTRTIQQPVVECAKICANKVLKRWDWPGTRIPLFPVLGEELNVDGKVLLRGVIAPAMDPQRMVNYLYSGAVEQVALSNKAPFIVAAGQVENYKQFWLNANTTNFAYLPYDPVSNAGTAVGPPQRQTAEPPIQAMVEMLAKSEEAIKATTSIYDPSLGNTNPREKSGRAIQALQMQAEHANSNYLDNVQRAMVDCGNELVKLCPVFYDRPGRLLKIAGIDDKAEQVMLGAEGGQPPPDPNHQQAALAMGMKQFFDLNKGNYSVTVDVSKSFSTKREEGAAVMGDMIAKNPQLLQIFGDLFFRDLDTPGSQEISERLQKLLPAPLQQGKDGEPNPQMLQGQLQQAGQMVDMLSKELQAKNQIIETDQIKAQQQLEEKKVDAAARIFIAKIQAGASISVADIKAGVDAAKLEMEQMRVVIEAAQEDRIEHRADLHESALKGMDHAHEKAMGAAQAALDQQSQESDQQHEAGLQADQHAAQSALQSQAAAEQPQSGE